MNLYKYFENVFEGLIVRKDLLLFFFFGLEIPLVFFGGEKLVSIFLFCFVWENLFFFVENILFYFLFF